MPDVNESSESIVSESVSETIVEEPNTEEKVSANDVVEYEFSMADVPAYNGEPYVELNNIIIHNKKMLKKSLQEIYD